jgi:riboflavin kinase / FMN adenylyltransferase
MTARTIAGRAAIAPEDGPILASVGVFDGLHLGHVWLLEHLVQEARLRNVRPAVITFDAHPDAVLLGTAPPLLMDPTERLERLGRLGVELVIVEHFDEALRRTPYDAFVAGVTSRCPLAGFVMTPDAAFGHDRAGTPAALAELGRSEGFDVVLVPPFTLEGREVRSSEIRAAIAEGDLAAAGRLLGRPYAVVGGVAADGRLTFAMPVALPPAGAWAVTIRGSTDEATIADGDLRIRPGSAIGRVRVEFAPDGAHLPGPIDPDTLRRS